MLSLIILSVLVLTWLTCFFYQSLAKRLGFLDHPDTRSAHELPIPTGAGIVLVFWFYIGLYLFWKMGFVPTNFFIASLGGLPIALVGFADDIKKLRWQIRASIHGVCSAWCIFWVGIPVIRLLGFFIEPNLLGYAFGGVALLWLINLYNFMDGIDGLAAAEVIFVCMAGILLAEMQGKDWLILNFLLATVAFAFLLFNWPPARLFMGDSGSGFLGFMLGLLVFAYDNVSLWSWVILLGYFITDACLTILIRLLRGEQIYNAHSQHAYQHITRIIGSKKTLYGVFGINVFWLLPIAVFAQGFPDYGPLLIVLSFSPLLLAQFFCGAGQVKPRLNI